MALMYYCIRVLAVSRQESFPHSVSLFDIDIIRFWVGFYHHVMGAALRRLDALAGEEALPKDAEKLRRRVQAAEKENVLLREQILEKQDAGKSRKPDMAACAWRLPCMHAHACPVCGTCAAPEPAFLNVKLMMPSVLGEANDVIWMSRKPMTKSRFLEVAQVGRGWAVQWNKAGPFVI